MLVSVSMDHMSFLGNTLEEIAEKKPDYQAGLPGCYHKTEKEAEQVILSVCEKYVLLCDFRPSEAEIPGESVFGQKFTYRGRNLKFHLQEFIRRKMRCWPACIGTVDEMGWHTTLEQRKEGLAGTSWKGRFTVINKKPLFIVDGAHNPGAADKMAESIRHYFNGKSSDLHHGSFCRQGL